jgi:hypothetical protein
MICCKIVANNSFVYSHFASLLQELGNKGSTLWDNQNLYFANTVDPKIDQRFVKKVLKKQGCSAFFIDEYGEDNLPNETDSANAWINDKLIKIAYIQTEEQQQNELRKIYTELSELDELLSKELNALPQQPEEGCEE